jgi:urease accessory protein
MLTVNKLIPRGRGLAPALLKRAATVALDWDARQKSRFDATDSLGRDLGVFLPRGSVVRGGDVLVAEDGSLVKVLATPQPVLVVQCAEPGSPLPLLRAAYHLGNRHVALEIQAGRLQIEPDHVLADMLRQMHLSVSEELAPFEPDAGAYGAHAVHTHEPGKPAAATLTARAPAHVNAHDSEGHERGHDQGHVHGPHCKHDHR